MPLAQWDDAHLQRATHSQRGACCEAAPISRALNAIAVANSTLQMWRCAMLQIQARVGVAGCDGRLGRDHRLLAAWPAGLLGPLT